MSSGRAEAVRRVFDAALERGPDSLAPFLDRACAEDSSLRDEVEALLASHRASGDFLCASALGLSAADVVSGSGAPTPERHIGVYKVVREIGRGGMGAVYLAERDDGEFEQRVAVKVLRPVNSNAAVTRRFNKERQILASLEHPNIARLIDGGSTGSGLPYFVMEYVEGQRIDRYCESKRLDTRARLELFRRVCAAVAYAHRNSVVHRDLKPSNIFVNEEGSPKLLDFGIAKVIGPTAPARPDDSTATVFRALTPEYASPEQMRGGPVTARSDIYSLGVVLCEMLTGLRPHDLVGLSPYEAARVVCEVEPRPPSALAAGDRREGAADGVATGRPLRRRLAGDLDQIVLRALRKEPEYRYASVEEFSEDVGRYLEGLPVAARKGALAYRCWKFVRRQRVTLAIALIVAALSLLLGVSLGLFSARPGARESIAVMPLVNTGLDPESEQLSDAITEYLINYFSRVPNLTAPGRNSVFLYKGKPVEPAAIGRALGAETLLTGRTTVTGDNLSVKIDLTDSKSGEVIWSKQYGAKTSEILSLQRELAEDVTQRLGLPVSAETRERAGRIGTRSVKAYGLYVKGIYYFNQRSELGLRSAVEYFGQAAEEDPNYALAYSGLANSYSLLGVYGSGPPKSNFPKAKEAALKAVALDPNSAEAHTSLAVVRWVGDWDWDAADQEFRRAVALNPNYVTAYHWYGIYLGEMGRFEEAVASEQRALELDPQSLYVRADLGRVYYYARRYDEALDQYLKGAELNPTFNGFYIELSLVYEQLQMADEWLSVVRRLGPLDPETEKAVREGGMRGLWRKRLEQFSKAGDTAAYVRAEVAARLGRADQAIEELNKGYEVRTHAMAQLKVNPAFDSIRSDPRFTELLRRMNLDR